MTGNATTPPGTSAAPAGRARSVVGRKASLGLLPREAPMSDGILAGLRIDQSRFPGTMTYAHNAALDAAGELLRNPDDRQVAVIDAVWRADHYPVVVTETGQIRCACGDAGDRDLHRVCVTLAAAAGGDQ